MPRLNGPSSSGTTGAGLLLPASGSRYLCANHITRSTGAHGPGNVDVHPLYVPVTCTPDALACEVTTVGAAGATVTMMIYEADPATGLPGALIAETAAIATDVGTGLKTGGISDVTLTPGWYYVGMVALVASATYRFGAFPQAVPVTAPNGASQYYGFRRTAQVAVPSPFGTPNVDINFAQPIVWLRFP